MGSAPLPLSPRLSVTFGSNWITMIWTILFLIYSLSMACKTSSSLNSTVLCFVIYYNINGCTWRSKQFGLRFLWSERCFKLWFITVIMIFTKVCCVLRSQSLGELWETILWSQLSLPLCWKTACISSTRRRINWLNCLLLNWLVSFDSWKFYCSTQSVRAQLIIFNWWT